jgi:Mn-containing catalase
MTSNVEETRVLWGTRTRNVVMHHVGYALPGFMPMTTAGTLDSAAYVEWSGKNIAT